MGQVIQGPWAPRAERNETLLALGTSECTIIRLRPPLRREGNATEEQVAAIAIASPHSVTRQDVMGIPEAAF